MMMKRFGALVVGLGFCLSASAQADKHYSMFAESPMHINPAAAGFHPAHLQVFTNFRYQWMSASDEPFRTNSGSLDWRFTTANSGPFLAAGLMFTNDQAGASGFTTNQFSVPIAYAIELNKENHLSIGLQPGFYQRTLSLNGLTWDNQWQGLDFNPNIDAGEAATGAGAQVSAFDLGAGIFWYNNVSRNFRVSLGLSGQHLTKQRVGYFSEEDRLFRKATLHGQFEYMVEGTGLAIQPAFMAFVQGPNKEITLGSQFRWHLRGESRSTGHFDDIHFGIGAFYRTRDALMVNMIVEFGGLGIGANYDLNMSGLTVATGGFGAMEFFLRWRMEFGGRSLSNPLIH